MCCKKGDPFQGPKVGSCLTLKDEMSKETQVLTKQETVGKRHLGGDQQGKGTQENCSATWLVVSGFMVKGFVFGFSLVNHSDAGSFLVVHTLLCQVGCQREGFWEVVGHVVSPFDLSQILLVGGGLLVPSSLPSAPVVK